VQRLDLPLSQRLLYWLNLDIWSSLEVRLGIPSNGLIAKSPYSEGRRVYRSGIAIFKVHLAENSLNSDSRQLGKLRTEYETLRRCAGISGIAQADSFTSQDGVCVLKLAYRPGLDITECPRIPAKAMFDLFVTVMRVSAKGVLHNDIKPQNIVYDPSFGVCLIDFDQATRTGFLSAAIGNLLGFSFSGSAPHACFGTIFKFWLSQRPAQG